MLSVCLNERANERELLEEEEENSSINGSKVLDTEWPIRKEGEKKDFDIIYIKCTSLSHVYCL